MDDLSEINQGRNPNLVELTDWTAVGTGIWNLSNGDLTVRQTENVNDLYYLAPYDVQNKSITFSMGVSGDTDNDYIGFVIGYEDSSIFIVLHGPNLNQVVVVALLTVGTFIR